MRVDDRVRLYLSLDNWDSAARQAVDELATCGPLLVATAEAGGCDRHERRMKSFVNEESLKPGRSPAYVERSNPGFLRRHDESA